MDFKDLWQKQKAVAPDINRLYASVKHFKRQSVQKLWLLNIALLATAGMIAYIFLNMHHTLPTTTIGTALVLLAIILYLLFANKLFTIYNKIDANNANSAYLNNLIAIKNKQKFLQTKITSVYFILLLSGLCLYMYEPLLKMPLLWKIFSYGLLFCWIAFVWFYLKPRTIKKKQAKIDMLINKFREIEKQLS